MFVFFLQESFHLPAQSKTENKTKSSVQGGTGLRRREHPETEAWRFGPAKVWYDQIGVPDDGSNLNYGFKLKEVWHVCW